MIFTRSTSKIWLVGLTCMVVWHLVWSGIFMVLKDNKYFPGAVFIALALILGAVSFSGLLDKSFRKYANSFSFVKSALFLLLTSLLILIQGIVNVIPILMMSSSTLIRDTSFPYYVFGSFASLALSIAWFGFNIYIINKER